MKKLTVALLPNVKFRFKAAIRFMRPWIKTNTISCDMTPKPTWTDWSTMLRVSMSH